MRRAAFIVFGFIVFGFLAFAATAGAASQSSPSASTGPVSDVASTSATVTGSVNPGGESTSWYVEYGMTTSYGTKTSSKSAGSGSSSVPITADLTSLSSSTTYHYRVVATNGSGTTHGGDGVVTTLSSPVPEVSTSSADKIGPFKARLHGTVDPNGASTSWYFEYGTSTSYGTKTAAQSAGSGTSAQSVSATVEGLQSGVTYHFRLVASSSAGTVESSDRTFDTDPPPAVKTGFASSVTGSSAVVSGTVNPKGRGSSMWFEYGTSTSYGSKTSAQDSGYGTVDKTFTATINGLKTGTTYHYRIVAKSDAGTVAGSDAAFKTSAAPSVTTGAASAVTASTATLAGSVNPNGRSTGWYFEYGPTTGYGTKTSSHGVGSGTSTTSFAIGISGLAPATTYHYRLVAWNSGGTTRGADATFATLGPPSVQTGPVTRLSTSTAVLSGKANSIGLSGSYWVEYGRTTSYGLRTGAGVLQPGTGEVTLSVSLSGLAPGVRYHYRFVASTAAGSTVGRDASFGTSPLPRGPNGRSVLCTIVGTVGPDTLRGTPGPDVICGLGGGDVIHGLGGNDVIYAGPGDDVVDGGAGNDRLYGGTGNDLLMGGPGNDRVDGGPGRDQQLGGPGRDLLVSRDGARDTVNGGPGRDRALVDRRRDTVVSIERRLSS